MRRILIAFVPSLLALAACDKLCHSNVNDVVSIDNHTGRALSLSVCQGGIPSTLKVLSVDPNQTGAMTLGSREQSYVVGGPTAQCDKPDGDKVENAVALTSQSFYDAKLCRDSQSFSRITLVERFQPCPTGTQEQAAPVDTCAQSPATAGMPGT